MTHNTKKVEATLETLTKINEAIISATKKQKMLLEALRHSSDFMSQAGRVKVYRDIDSVVSAKIRLTQRFNNLMRKII